jgi:hypothetical protein
MKTVIKKEGISSGCFGTLQISFLDDAIANHRDVTFGLRVLYKTGAPDLEKGVGKPT